MRTLNVWIPVLVCLYVKIATPPKVREKLSLSRLPLRKKLIPCLEMFSTILGNILSGVKPTYNASQKVNLSQTRSGTNALPSGTSTTLRLLFEQIQFSGFPQLFFAAKYIFKL